MNKEKIVKHMISFMEEKEKENKQVEMRGGKSIQRTINDTIIKELEKEIDNENQEH